MSTATLDGSSAVESPEKSLYARVGVLLGLRPAVRSEVDLTGSDESLSREPGAIAG